MDRTRASSLESHKSLCDKYDSYSSSLNPSKMCRRNRLHSFVGNQPEYSDQSVSADYYYKPDFKRTFVENPDLKSQFDVLQCTVNRMLNDGVFEEMGSAIPSVNLSEALKHEYRQMMSALKELESILGCKRKSNDTAMYSNTPTNNDTQTHQFQREIFYRDSLIKCLSDRLKVLCKANDKLIIDYENQENILSEELICLKRQLEKAKDALRSLSTVKSRSHISAMQAMENETFYLRESLRNKELMINDLKHRLDKVNRDNADLKCELEDKEVRISHYESNRFDRELSFSNRLNEQLQVENDCKTQLIKDLQNKLDLTNIALQDHSKINQLRNELLLVNEENEMSKEAFLDQSDLLNDYRNQIKMLSESNHFKEETICELQCCIRQLTECPPENIPIRDQDHVQCTIDRSSQSIEIKSNNLNTLLNLIKKHLTQNQPDLLRLIDNDLDVYDSLEKFFLELIGKFGKTNQNQNDIELFKEFLTNEINLKNTIIKFLTGNLSGDIESLEKLQAHMNSILAYDMDKGCKNDLKSYLHNCYLLDDNLRNVIEYLVKSLNEIANKNQTLSLENLSLIEKNAIYVPNKLRDIESFDTNSKMTSTMNTQEGERSISSQYTKIQQLEDELQILKDAQKQDKKRFNCELEEKNQQFEGLNRKLSEFQKIIDEKSRLEIEFNQINSDYKNLLNKSKEYQLENDRLKGEIEVLTMKNQQIDRNLQKKTSELDNLEMSMRRVSDQFANLSLTQEHVKKSIESIKDAEIDRLNKEIDDLKSFKNKYNDLKLLSTENTQRNSLLMKNYQSLELQNNEMKLLIDSLQRELDKSNMEKMELLGSFTNLQEEKNRLIEELRLKAIRDSKSSLQLKSIQTEPNNELLELIEKLKRDNQQLVKQLQQNEVEEMQLKTNVNSLKIENKTMEIRNNSINSDRNALENQIKLLRDRISEINRNCQETHINKQSIKSDAGQSDVYKQKVVDLEGILVCLTDELNEKVELVENLRKLVKNDECVIPCADPCVHDTVDINQQLLLQKDSEIAFLKSKIEMIDRRSINSQTRIPSCELNVSAELGNLKLELAENEKRVEHLNQQLNERSENLANLQQLLKEKDEIIQNSLRMIKAKSDALSESEKILHSLTLENTNIKEDLSNRFQDESQLKLSNSTIKNLTREIENLRTENDKLRLEITKLNNEKQRKSHISSESVMGAKKALFPDNQLVHSENSVQQINSEIHKLYVDFEGKSNEIREFSLKEIKNRDRKIDELNLELKLKSDQFTTIMVENRRLLDRFEDESQKSGKYEQNLLLKEQLLEKLLKDKEKIRATFITELQSKNEELNEKNKTVYFLNAELHRLASEIEVLSSELHVVKISDNYQVKSKNALEITQTNLDNLKTENNSLRLCINLKMSELDSMKNELTIKQIQNEKMSNEIENFNSKSLKTEEELKQLVEQLTRQLEEIQSDYRNLIQTKSNMESIIKDLEKENLGLKQTKELLENEKVDYKIEIDDLKSKIDYLNNNLVETKNKIVRKSMKSESEQREIQKLSDIINLNEKSIANQSKTLNQAIQQIDELTEENSKYKIELEKISNKFYELEEEYRILTGKFETTNEQLKTKENEIENYKEHENQLNNGLNSKSNDCEQLQREYNAVLKQCEEFQEKFVHFENLEQNTLRTIDEKNRQCICLQENLEYVKNQLFTIEDKLKICNNQWLEKYGALKCNYEQLECDYLQIQNQFNLINQDRDILQSTINNQTNKLLNFSENFNKLNEDNSHLIHENRLKETEFEKLCCEKSEIENCNSELTRKFESINNQLRLAHREICDLTIQLNENREKINENQQSPIKHYGSHPVLNKIDLSDFQHKDYCDLKTRYSALCSQIDNLINQLKKKDKRIMEIQKEKEILCHNLSNYEQIQCDYQELDYKYQQLKDDFNNLSHYYQNINYSHNSQKTLEMQKQEVSSVIRGCAEELQETIDCHNREIEQMKLTQQELENDYRICCSRLKELEEQIRIDNLELEKWNQSYYSSENDRKQLEEKFDQLKYDYDDVICQVNQLNELKQDLIDKTNRINEITHINDNIEQQIVKAHQQINNQNQIIENYKSKLNEMELYYEKEIEQYRHELTKSVEKSSSTSINYEEIINCLNEKNHSLECELLDLQNQFHEQNLNLNELKSQQELLLMKTEQLKQEYDQQCANIDKLSGQLFDKNDLIEQMTADNHQMNSDLEMNHLKMTQLTEQNDCLNQFLLEKNNELHSAVDNSIAKERESIKLSSHANYLSGQLEQRDSIIEDFKKELAGNYDSIEEIKQENSKLCDEIEKLSRLISEKDQCINSKNELLNRYCKELEMNYELINKLQSEQKPKSSSISAQEFFEMKQINEKLNQELEYLHRKLDTNIQSTETQTLKDKQEEEELHRRDYLIDSPSPISDFRIYHEQDSYSKIPSENKETDLTYSTTKSVAWKSTHTDKPENVGSGVLELQKAIDEYNTLVTSIEMSDGLLNINAEKEPGKKIKKISSGNLGGSISADLSSLNPKIDIDLDKIDDKVDEIDIIVVDVDSSTLAPNRTVNPNLPIHAVQTVSNEESIEHFHPPNFKNVIDLLKSCNVQIDFDERKETFDIYFHRMMQKYNELEQFYLASMKINLETLEDPLNIQNMELFTELYEKSQEKLIQNCQLLKSSVSFNMVELNDNIQSINDQKLISGDLLKLVDLITTQQLQLGAINLTYMNLQKLIPIDDEKQHNVIPTYLTEEYQKVLLTKNVCNPNIVTPSLNVSQLSLDKEKFVPKNEKKELISSVNFENHSMESLSIYRNSQNDISKATFIKEEPNLNFVISYNSVDEKDTLQNKFEKSDENLTNTNISIEKDNQNNFLPKDSTTSLENMVKKDSKSISFPNLNELTHLPETVENQNFPEISIKLESTEFVQNNDHMNTGQEFQQQIYQSSTIPESKTQAIATLDDAISYASIGQFEKTMHQLNSIDFENFDGSIDMKDRVRIYAAEIDYLNEKNLFHSYAINTITNPTRYPLNANFLQQITKSLTAKAVFIDTLQKEFKFEPHISKKEKQLIDKILDSKNSFTFEKLFEDWINEMGNIENQKTSEELTEKIKELTKKLELCQSQMNVTNVPDDSNSKLIETLISEKKILFDQLNDCMLGIGKMNQESSPLVLKSPGSEVDSVHQQLQICKSTMDILTKENERLKELLKSSSDKIQSVNQEYSHDKSKQSKIPLLKGSSIEGNVTSVDRKSMKWEDVNKRLLTDITNISKNIHQVTETVKPFKHTDNNADELVRASKEIVSASTKMEQEISVIKSSQKFKKSTEKDDKSLLQSAGKLVSPEEVKSAIEGETSIESLKKFAILLAEDNFDLAAEIEKLLVTIEELRRQLKENCEILSETVDMLQNSENFVNQLEKKLNIETKKTQVITTRIDKLNELNGRVIFELERILKQPPSTATADMSSQERYDYLFECLKKIESENLSLLKKRDELELLLQMGK